ncbi:HAMP domain-containing sensor histidine kinase [Winogradskya consettensis]|uniref:Signal transduction histidine-protein kinase/phosphatase MprB n=1 Tax=Winogradskya consettensis TaxID=113560 RepID=A0A919VSQ0_9ACTN|nr:HAMP domain-containing sensor histidine kinase [Actinoplanes consettensis]GIM75056.1 two-component sensor histidine kinase [Actinoplanes consettensis]
MRRRLTLLVAATTVLVLIAFLVPLAILVRQAAADKAVSQATVVLQTIVPLVGNNPDDQLSLSLQGQPVPVSVFTPSGAVLGEPAEQTPAVRLAASNLLAFTVATGSGREIVAPVAISGRGVYVVRTVVPDADLTRGVARSWLVLAGLGLTLVLLGLAVADRLARTLVAPIADLSAVSHRLARAELSARASPSGPPEVREVAGALNHLAGRIQDLLREEREQVADISHRLRTPLTALRLEVESLRDPGEAGRVAAAADSIERAVTLVIQQARRRGGERKSCDATTVVADRVAFWTVLAEDTDRLVRQELPDNPLLVALPADELAAALDALLGNVFAHTPDGTALAVTLRPHPSGGATLTVSDEGPGFPAQALLRGASGSGSTGLGLDIARRAAETGGGSLQVLTAPTGGALVRMDLAAAPLTEP